MLFRSRSLRMNREKDAIDHSLMTTTTTKSLPPLLINSYNERKAHFKNLQEQIRLDKLLDHLQVQERVYVQLFRKQRRVVELMRSRATAVKWSSRVPRVSDPTPASRASTTVTSAALHRSMSLPDTGRCLMVIEDVPTENSPPAQPQTPDSAPVQSSKQEPPYLSRQPRSLDLGDLLLLTPLSLRDEAPVPDNDDQNCDRTQHSNYTSSDHVEVAMRGSWHEPSMSILHQASDRAACAGLVRPASASGRLFPAMTSSADNEINIARLGNPRRCKSSSPSLLVATNKSGADEDLAIKHVTWDATITSKSTTKVEKSPPLPSASTSDDKYERQTTAKQNPAAGAKMRKTVMKAGAGQESTWSGMESHRRVTALTVRQNVQKELRRRQEQRRRQLESRKFDVGQAIDRERSKYGVAFLPRIRQFVSQFSREQSTTTGDADHQPYNTHDDDDD